jgi:hypothetical protein
MRSKLSLTVRQITALYRVAHSMNNVGGRISVANDNMLTVEEMRDLEARLRAGVPDESRIEVVVEQAVEQPE